MVLKKKDFIEIEFTARTKEGELFDSNIAKDLKESNLNIKPRPVIFSLGEGMFLKGVDDFLIGKDVGKHEIKLLPDNAFGIRDSRLVQTIPMRIFREQKLVPVQGAMFNFDGRVAKILSVSGGRIIADFNNPIAGKTVVYNVNVVRNVDDINEKARAFIDFIFRREIPFEVKEKKIIVKTEKNLVKFLELFKDKFKETLDLDLEVKEEENSKEKSATDSEKEKK